MKINQESSPASSGATVSDDNDAIRVRQWRAGDYAAVKHVRDLLITKSAEAWKIYNVLSFMVEALPEDKPGELPVHCTLVDLREELEKLASGLMEITDNGALATTT
ncbi:hypothetical protein WS84_04180 [Burkholderia anthina]|uniref:hypothetical protein n=1 Tax=Burkholderia anthina TaxID=179879 RepID=UPI00075CF721|nr:hypothetical protein [Burkholderia anthina]KVH02764.1 hypothetical protein WS84_04180 [Burkholderia anthina]KVH11833.1 hypothetical protein WS85_13720 [Burkholderia anthina]KVM90652.1 hypothetical protein WT06_16705 [Burkholderia anthina]KVX31863.1 hypothetical protein WT32_23260 [Burkholderia anthina]